ncbi:D-2-hydroxyacid dehydrogenase [Pseudoalteromonas sp. T1lg75]|uniref:D-2-hydroxyacid dehydrogenase n=1 Tax=Pseudoalteromonas sp. T1lg75 TaxID=2077102 RepID=UPI000CF64258|nr:D-2-hydroxyacid dehydrogenase [Pseudoalteromonas sp. T1lg75]
MKIVMLDASTLGDNSLAPIEALGQLHSYALTRPQDVVARCDDAEVIITNKVRLGAEQLKALPKLKLICVAATGTNNIDINAAQTQGIAVCNVAGYSTASVVQHTFTLISLLLNNLHRYIHDCRQGAWQQSDMFCRLDYDIAELAGKKIAIIGHGELGQAVAKVAHAFDMQVLIAERRNQAPRPGRIAFEQALAQADIITIHCPLNAETEQLINRETLALMQPSAVLVNTARGAIINEADLASALAEGTLAAAALDVLSEEPADPNNPLVRYRGDNLLLTPHIAWASSQARDRLIHQLALNIRAFADGEVRNRVG